MLQNLKSGRVKAFIGFFKKAIKNFKPRYNLSLDSHSYEINQDRIIYYFKVFGDHSFIKLGFDEIQSSKDLIYSINPFDLIAIAKKEQVQAYKKSLVKVTELLRDNKYKISDKEIEQIFTGDEICENPSLMEKMNNLDLFRISYNTGFCHGRSLEKIVRKKTDNNDASNVFNVIALNKE